MKENSQKAARFVVTTAKAGNRVDEYGATIVNNETYVFSPDTTIREVFETIWENTLYGFSRPDSVAIRPDINSIPANNVGSSEAVANKEELPF